ncbi:hypothetical protein PSKAS_52760 [Peribacillus sp. N1]
MIWRWSGDRPAYCAELMAALPEETEYADVELGPTFGRLVDVPSLGLGGCTLVSIYV